MKMIRSSPDATPSSAFKNPEKVTEDWYLAEHQYISTACTMKWRGAPILASLHALVKRCINVLDQHKAALWSVGEEMIELIIGKTPFGEIKYADII
jgi:hypothetical protein